MLPISSFYPLVPLPASLIVVRFKASANTAFAVSCGYLLVSAQHDCSGIILPRGSQFAACEVDFPYVKMLGRPWRLQRER